MANRFDYVEYDQHAQDLQHHAKKLHQGLENFVDNLGPGRAAALAQTKLEEAYMWIGKAIRDDQIARKGSAPLQEQRRDDSRRSTVQEDLDHIAKHNRLPPGK